jgi:hypothetical protein
MGKSASETDVLLTLAYGDYAMKKLSVFEWHRQIEEGREDVHGDPRSGQPKTWTDYEPWCIQIED